ncbi:MAG: leucine-rich repeat protein [Prolixibacteraceae bacterium]|nr:leucine-rich repeat protein [Prolixibacteraceae bacterium]
MKKLIFLFFFLFLIQSLSAKKIISINVTAGGLSSALTAVEKRRVKELKVNGEIDFRDFLTIRDSLPRLRKLDLSDVKIVEFADNQEGEFYQGNEIPISAFERCYGLESVKLPQTINSIGDFAFEFCYNLEKIFIPSSVISIGESAFFHCGCYFKVDSTNANFSSVDGVLYNKTQNVLIHYPGYKEGDFIIPSTVDTIEDEAFDRCYEFTSVTIPTSVTSFGSNIFEECSNLESVSLLSEKPNDLFDLASQLSFFADENEFTIYVPFGSIKAYRQSWMWEEFPSIKEMKGVKLSPGTLTVTGSKRSMAEVDVLSNTGWTAKSDQDWLTISPKSGNGDKKLSIMTAANKTELSRKATVVVMGGGTTQNITIFQLPNISEDFKSAGKKADNLFDEYNSLKKLVHSNNDFAFKIYKASLTNNDNLFISPFSLHIALSAANQGAATTTRKEIDHLLSLKDINEREIKYCRLLRETTNLKDSVFNKCIQDQSGENILDFANSLWVNEDFSIDASYKCIIEEYYFSEVFDFSKTDISIANQKLNNWISEKTNGKINDISGLNQKIRLSIINAIYFMGEWDSPFDVDRTITDIFHSPEGDKSIDYMNEELIYGYYEDEDIQSIFVPYKCNQFSMIVILPKMQFGILDVEEKINSDYLAKIYKFSQSVDVDLSLPKFRIESEIYPKDDIIEMGYPEMFSDLADFSGLSSNEYLKIDDIIHKTFIEVDEKGTEAAAVTKMDMLTVSAFTIPKVFKADHPFIFLIVDNRTDAILFMGRYVK